MNKKKIARERKVSMGVKIAPNLLQKLDIYAENSGLSRSSAVSAVLSMYFQGQESMTAMQSILAKLDEVQQGQEIAVNYLQDKKE